MHPKGFVKSVLKVVNSYGLPDYMAVSVSDVADYLSRRKPCVVKVDLATSHIGLYALSATDIVCCVSVQHDEAVVSDYGTGQRWCYNIKVEESVMNVAELILAILSGGSPKKSAAMDVPYKKFV